MFALASEVIKRMDSFGHFDGGPGCGEWIPDRDGRDSLPPVIVERIITSQELLEKNLAFLKSALRKIPTVKIAGGCSHWEARRLI